MNIIIIEVLLLIGEVIQGSEVQNNYTPDPVDIEARACVNKIKNGTIFPIFVTQKCTEKSWSGETAPHFEF